MTLTSHPRAASVVPKHLRLARLVTLTWALAVTPGSTLAFEGPGTLDNAAPDPASQAKAAFERLKGLDGAWVGKSTKGWEEVITFKTIAQGSVVHASSFDAHPSETMATMYYLDGDRLLLTHYCVSKTQPRLKAETFEMEGRKITFSFVDGGNLESRDKGHMDKVVIRFLDDGHFTSQWTWYKDGKEQWFEEIKYERKAGASADASSGSVGKN